MDRERLDGWCERGILGLVLALLVYSPLAWGAVRPTEFVLVQWLIVGMLLLWLPRFYLNPKHRLLWPPLCWAVLLFMGYAVARYLTADIEFVARQELIRVLIYGFIFFVVLNNLHRQETTQMITVVLVFLAMLLALYAVYQFLTDSDKVLGFTKPAGYRKRGSGTFICPNHLAGYLEMLLPLALVYTLAGRFGHVMKVLFAYASLAIFTGIVVTVSRGGWIACVLSLVVLFLWLLRQRDFRLQGLLVVGAFVAICLVFFFKARLSQNRFDSLALASETEDVRFKIWRPAWKMWQDHYWWGTGPGHFDYRFRPYRPGNGDLQHRPDRAHNDYLNTLVDWGLVGACLVAAAWAAFFWDVCRSWKFVQRSQNDFGAKRSNKSSVVIGGTVGLLAILLHSFVDFNMHIPSNAILAVTLMALVSGHFRFATEQYWHTARWPIRVPVTTVLLAGLGFLCGQSVRRTAELYWLTRAQSAEHNPAVRVPALEKAFTVETRNSESAYEIGEALRLKGWPGQEGYQALLTNALQWFQRSIDLNPFDPAPYVRSGMCLDWIGDPERADVYFKKAVELDPHGYYTLAHMGWHHVQREDYATAKTWLERSLHLVGTSNRIAQTYLKIVEERLAEKFGER